MLEAVSPRDSLLSVARIVVGLLMLALVLFILAPVFRIGAEMRSELEGTV